MSFARRSPPRDSTAPTPRAGGGTVTALKAQAHDPNRVNVFLDGEFAFGLEALTSVDEGLRIGVELDAERVDALRALDETSKATDAAIGLLAHRPRSVQEIRRRLLLKGFGAATIDGALDRLERWRYVDDEAFARFWVENREANKPRGRRLIEQELRTKGLDREIIAQAISEAEIDEHAAALGLARGRLHSYSGMDQAMARRRLGAWLARRGYGYDVVKPVLAAVFTGADDDAEDGDEEPG